MGKNLSVILMSTPLIQVQLFPIPENPKNISTFHQVPNPYSDRES